MTLQNSPLKKLTCVKYVLITSLLLKTWRSCAESWQHAGSGFQMAVSGEDVPVGLTGVTVSLRV